MDILTISLILVLLFLINPIRDLEEKIITTLFLTLSYIIILSYVLSNLYILLYKWIYVLLPFLFLMYKFRKFKLDEFKNKKIKLSNEFKILCILIFVLLLFFYINWVPFPKAHTDLIFHSHKIKQIILEKNVFSQDFGYYPSGFHLLIYIVSNDISEILKNIAYFRIIFLGLIALSYYYLGSVFDKKLGLFAGLWGMVSPNIEACFIAEVYPNLFGYIFLLISIAFSLKYLKTKNKVYLYLLSLGICSMAFTHIFPLLMYFLFLISLFIVYLFNLRLFNIYITCIISLTLSYILTTFRNENIKASIISKSKALCVDKIGWDKLLKHVFYAMGYIAYGYNIIKNFVYLLFNFYIFILGIIYALIKYKKYGASLVILFILSLIWTLNVNIGFYIPFYSSMYNLERGIQNLFMLIPIFYGFGTLYIFNLKKNKFLRILLFVGVICSLLMTLNVSDTIIKNSEKSLITISNDDFRAFNWFNSNNISNKIILNQFVCAGHGYFLSIDGSIYLPFYTQNKVLFSYLTYSLYAKYYKKLINYTYTYNYAEFLSFLKKYNVTYIYYTDNTCKNAYINISKYKFNKKFFENESYFKKVYESGTVSIYKVKYSR